MADTTLPKTLTVSQAAHLVIREWKRDENTFHEDDAAGFLEELEDKGLDLNPRQRAVVESALVTTAWGAAHAALKLLAQQNPPVIVVPDPPPREDEEDDETDD